MHWSVPRDWAGETVFVLASGPSVKSLDLSPLEGRRVITVKSSWVHWPKADFLFFADGRWWREPGLKPGKGAFLGSIVTTANELGDPGLRKLKKVDPKNGFATARDTVALSRTSTTGAINLAVHLGAKRIVLVGVDGKLGLKGERHSHGLKWPWPQGGLPKSFADQAREYRQVAPSAEKLGVEIVNANPESAIDVWPRVSFEEAVREVEPA